MKMKKKMILILCSVFVIFLSACGRTGNDNDKEDIKPVPVKVQVVSTGNISLEYTYAARLKPERQVVIIPEVAGKVQQVYFNIGDTVNEGDILFKVDEKSVRDNIRDLEKQLEAVNLNIELQKLSLESAKEGQHRQQLLQLEQQVQMAQINFDTAQKSFQDIKNLHDKGMASQQQYNQAESGFRQAEVALKTARESYELYITQLSQTNIETREKQLEQTRIQKEQLTLGLNNLHEMLGKTAVKSPISGVVASRNVEKDQMVSAQTAPFTIIQTQNLFIDVGVSERVVGRIQVNDPVRIQIGSLSNNPYTGEIFAIAPAADERTSNYLTKIKLDNQNQEIKSGMFAEVSFAVDSRQDVIVIPINSVLFESGNSFVYVVDQGKTARRVQVQTGIDNGTHIEVINGLAAGDSLIVEGQNFVDDNVPVILVE